MGIKVFARSEAEGVECDFRIVHEVSTSDNLSQLSACECDV